MPTNSDRKHPIDPTHSGAKPGTFGADADYAAPPQAAGLRFGESHAMSMLLAQNWWALALRGLFAILFGVAALLMTGPTIGALVLLFAAYMLVDGVFTVIAGVRAAARHERWGALVLEGVADLIAAAIAFLMPIATILAFVWLAAAWAIVSGAMLLAATFRLPRTHGKWAMGLGGFVSVIWGIVLFFVPVAGAVVMTWWLGIYALVFGVAMLALAFRLKSHSAGSSA